MVATAAQALSDRNAHDAAKLAESDEEMDELRKGQFRVMLGSDWPYGVEAAVDVALLGRYYERIADHAASWPAGSSTSSPAPIRSARTGRTPEPHRPRAISMMLLSFWSASPAASRASNPARAVSPKGAARPSSAASLSA